MPKNWMLIRDLATGVAKVVSRTEGEPLVERSICAMTGKGYYESKQTAEIDKGIDEMQRKTNSAVALRRVRFGS